MTTRTDERMVAVHIFVPGQHDMNNRLTPAGRLQTTELAVAHFPVSPPILEIAGDNDLLAETLAAVSDAYPAHPRTAAETIARLGQIPEFFIPYLSLTPPPSISNLVLHPTGADAKATMKDLLVVIARRAVELLEACSAPEQFLLDPLHAVNVAATSNRLFAEFAVPSADNHQCLKPGGSVTYHVMVKPREVRIVDAQLHEPAPLREVARVH